MRDNGGHAECQSTESSFAPKVERRVVAQLLALTDGLESRGRVIDVTNIPDSLDPALRRPGRLDRTIEMGIPDRKGRSGILRIHIRGMPLAADVELDKVAEISHGCVGPISPRQA